MIFTYVQTLIMSMLFSEQAAGEPHAPGGPLGARGTMLNC